MKKILSAFIAIIMCSAVQAQTQATSTDSTKVNPQFQTVFSNPGKLGWWVSPDWAWTSLNSRDAFLMGISGGIIMNHSFSIGLGGYGILNSNNLKYSNINDTADVYLYGGYGGLKLEYRLYPMNMINVAFPVMIGWGGITYSTVGYNDWQNPSHEPIENSFYVWDSYFAFEPGVVVGVNLLKFMRFDVGASYRITSNIDLPKTDKDLMNGFNLNMSLKFGKF